MSDAFYKSHFFSEHVMLLYENDWMHEYWYIALVLLQLNIVCVQNLPYEVLCSNNFCILMIFEYLCDMDPVSELNK